MKKEYDLYKEYEKIYLKGNINDKTDFEIYIEETDREVIVKVPNTIKPYDKIKLSGLGKKKSDNKYGDLYISFNKVLLECDKEDFNSYESQNIIMSKKYEYKYLQSKSSLEIDEIIEEYAKNGWKCISIQPIITKLEPSENYEKGFEYTPDYEFNILFEREIIK